MLMYYIKSPSDLEWREVDIGIASTIEGLMSLFPEFYEGWKVMVVEKPSPFVFIF